METNKTDSLIKRIEELALRAESRNIFTFTDFLSPAAIENIKRLPECKNALFFGGSEVSERKIARFGDEEELGYSEPFP